MLLSNMKAIVIWLAGLLCKPGIKVDSEENPDPELFDVAHDGWNYVLVPKENKVKEVKVLYVRHTLHGLPGLVSYFYFLRTTRGLQIWQGGSGSIERVTSDEFAAKIFKFMLEGPLGQPVVTDWPEAEDHRPRRVAKGFYEALAQMPSTSKVRNTWISQVANKRYLVPDWAFGRLASAMLEEVPAEAPVR